LKRYILHFEGFWAVSPSFEESFGIALLMMLQPRANTNFFSRSKFVKELGAKDFDVNNSKLLKSKDCCIIMFYAPWCGHCKNMKPIWEQVGQKTVFFKVYSVNCEKQSELLDRIREEDPSFVQYYPTIVIYNKGRPVKKLQDRNVETLVSEVMRSCSQ